MELDSQEEQRRRRYRQSIQAQQQARKQEDEIKYPYTFQELADKLNIWPPFNQFGYFQKQAAAVLQDELNKMYDIGYDIYFKNQCQHNEKGICTRRFLRRVKMFYNCLNSNCPKFEQSQNRHNKWPTIYGLIYITFKFVDIKEKKQKLSSSHESEEELKYPYVLRYNIKLYEQKCQACNRWLKGQIYSSQMEIVAKMFCFQVAKILTLEEDPAVRPYRQFDEDEVLPPIDTTHQKENCQACDKKVCKIIPRRRTST